jgi:uncharacterized protein YjiS (DUF1127 family)
MVELGLGGHPSNLTSGAGERWLSARDLTRNTSARFVRWCSRCLERSRQRQALASLEDHLLADIGVTRQRAKAEAAKPFWK